MSELTRDEAEAVMDAVKKIAAAVEEIPHKLARAILSATNDITSIVGEAAFPGGYYGRCVCCEEPKGQDEMHNCGDEDVCSDCLSTLAKEEAKNSLPSKEG